VAEAHADNLGPDRPTVSQDAAKRDDSQPKFPVHC
jgi:hypothetical protein